MSETLFKFFLDELETIRVICPNAECGTIVEMPIERIPVKLEIPKCKYCGHDFERGSGESTNLSRLANAIVALKAASKDVRLEFLLPKKD